MSNGTTDAYPPPTPAPPPPKSDRPRVVWLHTQPEHYFNCMMDDLAAGKEAGGVEWVAGFQRRGPGWYTENAVPKLAPTIFLKPLPGKEKEPAGMFGREHADWRADLLPLQPDALIVSGYGSRTAREMLAYCRGAGIPVAMWTDSNIRSQRGRTFRERLRRRLKRRFLRPIMRNASLILVANSLGTAYWRYFGYPRERLVLCPCYSDYPRLEAARARARGDVLRQFGLAPEAKYFFTAARLAHAKGLDLMIDAFRAGGFAERGYQYLIAGTGPLKEALEARARDGGMTGAIRLLGFQQPADNLALMAQAELFVLPSRYEPHGIVVSESMAAGTPVVASDVVGAAADLVWNGGTGAIFKTEDAADLRETLERLVGDPEGLARMRIAARDAFERWFAATSPIVVANRVAERLLARKSL